MPDCRREADVQLTTQCVYVCGAPWAVPRDAETSLDTVHGLDRCEEVAGKRLRGLFIDVVNAADDVALKVKMAPVAQDVMAELMGARVTLQILGVTGIQDYSGSIPFTQVEPEESALQRPAR